MFTSRILKDDLSIKSDENSDAEKHPKNMHQSKQTLSLTVYPVL